MRTLGVLTVLAAMAGAVPPLGRAAAGQAAQEPPHFKSGVDVVEVAILARDGAGKPVADLRRDEISVLENGVPQTLVAFERVSLPVQRAPTDRPPIARAVASDVASNESTAPSRVFVLVLDSHHVAATRVQAVRKIARQFVENHVGPDDYVAVFSPGALASATQDFTTDKARVLGAIDQFTGMKMSSALIEVDREQAAAERGGRGAVAMHGGKDPSDGERSDRALALGGTLEALAAHLERIPGRRKSLLLFSEGVDYNTADVLGVVQRNASDVMRSMGRAIGALMRTNVAVYAIDPRGANAADADLLETPLVSQAGMRNELSGRSLSEEQNDSIRTLHSLSDSTGGFAAVNRNDFASAFERIVDETSSYYVVGYTPLRAAKPGEFRSIAVKVSRPGVRVSARSGYAGKPEAERRVGTAVASMPGEPSPGFGMPSTRGRGRAPEPIAAPPAPAATAGLLSPLQVLLASPLPQPGLPIRVQAVTLGGDGRKADVRLVIEVLGRRLQFDESGGRFNERLALALLTVDENGKGSNGTSIDVDLRLTPEDLARVRDTGVRWLSTLALPPGRHQLRVAGRADRTGITGMITHDIVVPEIRRRGVDLSGVTITSVPSVLMITKGKPWLEQVLPTPPTAARTFVAGDQLTAAVEVYRAERGAADATLTARVEAADGAPTSFSERRAVPGAGPRREPVGFQIGTARLPAGRYVLRITLDGGSERLERAVPFEIVGR